MPVRRPVYTALLTLLALPAAHAADNVPAQFPTGEDSLTARIEFPEIRGEGSISLRCAAKVDDDGDMDENGCFSDANNAPVFIQAVNKAAKKANMIPAVIGGKRKSVYVQYQIEFRKEGDEQTISLLNNPGVLENVEAYGADYIAAQRSLTKEKWQKVCPRHTRFQVWAKAHVAETGEQSSISLAPNEGPAITERCEEAIIATLEEAAFAPALDGSGPVPSTYVEPFGN